MQRRLLLLPFLFVTQFALSQARYNFFTIGTDQGLSNPNVWSINQDKYGFIWIATVNGLNRYDGHSIKQYFHNSADKHSIAGNTTFWIFRDSDDEMWFACGADGLSRYNYASDNFESLPAYDSARKNNRYNSPVWRLGEDYQKRVYLSCGAACYRYDKLSGKFEDLTPLFGKDWDYGIGKFFMQDKSLMWIATDNGLFRFNIAANKMEKIPFDIEKMGYGSASMYDVEMLDDHEMLISMERAGYVLFNTITNQFRPADKAYDPAFTRKLTQMGDVMKDSRGRFWISNSTFGLIEYFPKDGHSISMKKELLYPYPYPEQEGQGKALFEDRDGNIWFGTSTQGIVRFQPDLDFIQLFRRDYAQAHSLPDNYVTAFSHSGEGNRTWIGTAKGICEFDPLTNAYTNYPFSVDYRTAFPGAFIRKMIQVKDTLFVASQLGLSMYDRRRQAFKEFHSDSENKSSIDFSLFDNDIRNIIALKPGELLLSGSRLARFYPATGHCYASHNSPGDTLYQFRDVSVVRLDSARHVLWLGLQPGRLYSYDLATQKATRHFYRPSADTTNEIAFFDMSTDTQGNLWMATSKGLIVYDPARRTSNLTILPKGSGNILNVVCPGIYYTWFSTLNEVGRVNRQTKKTEIFSLSTLLPNTGIVSGSMQEDSEGNLWIGTNQGYCVLNTDNFISNTTLHLPHLVNFKVFDQVKHFGLPYQDLERIDLLYGENFFSFDFSSFNFQNIQGTHYSYMLEGFDKDWNYTKENSGSYTNVPPGSYHLLIRSSNISGGWDLMKQKLVIRVHPPFWLSAWFAAICVALLMAISVWLFFRFRRMQLKKNINKTIDYFANSVYGENSVNEICWDIARNCISQLQFEDCVVYLLDENKGMLIQKAAYGPKNPKGHEIINPIEIQTGKGIVGTVAVTGKPLIVADTSGDNRYIVDDEKRLSELCVPILHDGRVIGIIDSENSRKNFFTEDHLKALATIASISANKIAEAQAEAYAKENELKLLEINKMLAESQLMALRAQMNPHFVFNCLNSIQECIVTHKYGEASKYLNKFSKLFRMVLNNSGRNLVVLDEEKEVLQLYLQLEEMRFEQSFSWEMNVDDELETDEILIPSMLLQPYVENALWHGLMHKPSGRKLIITFTKVSEDLFRCIIDDNGIGRKKSFELKEQQSKAKRHESKGLQISRDRLEILYRQGYNAGLQIIDKEDAAGESTGTTVIIEISTFLKN